MKSLIDNEMQKAVSTGVFPAADLLVAKNHEILYQNHYGDARSGTTFDTSSLTKPISTAHLAMILMGEDSLKPDQTLSHWFEYAKQEEHKQITVEMLMNHRSGLPAWRPFYRELPSALIGTQEGKEFIINACLNESLQSKPGEVTNYSDLGYMLLGAIVEKAAKAPLDELFAKLIAKPLGLKDSFYIRNTGDELRTTSRRTDTHPNQHVPTGPKPSAAADEGHHKRFAATEDCPWRGRVIHGQVHDQNAYAMGGVAGHAGLFSTSLDIHLFIKNFMESFDGEGLIKRETLNLIFPVQDGLISPPTQGVFVGGWDTPFERNSAAGSYMSRHTIGHLGYTGCSVWIDQKQDVWIILLTNRIHPSTTNEKIKAFRPHIHDLIYNAIIKP